MTDHPVSAGRMFGLNYVSDEARQARAELLERKDLEKRKAEADARVADIKAKIAALDLDPLRSQLNSALADAEAVAVELAAK